MNREPGGTLGSRVCYRGSVAADGEGLSGGGLAVKADESKWQRGGKPESPMPGLVLLCGLITGLAGLAMQVGKKVNA